MNQPQQPVPEDILDILVDEADVEGHVRVDRVAGEGEGAGAGRADALAEHRQHDRGDEAEEQLGQAKARARSGDHEVAGRREADPAARGRGLDEAHAGEAGAAQEAEHAGVAGDRGGWIALRDLDCAAVARGHVGVAVRCDGEGTLELKRRSLYKSLEYSAWPFVGYLHAIHRAFARYPRYAVAMSSDGPDAHYPAYGYVAVAKAVLETFVRYMATHLFEDGCKVLALRSRQVMTESYKDMFGPAQVELGRRFAEFACTPEEIADTTLALCSGMFDAMSGQVVTRR